MGAGLAGCAGKFGGVLLAMEAGAQVGVRIDRVIMVRRWNDILSAGRVFVAMVWVDVVRGWGFWIVRY